MGIQSARAVLMIEPVAFGPNPETMGDNSFQSDLTSGDKQAVSEKAKAEFNLLKQKLEENGVSVRLYHERVEDQTPDALFPNNWFSTHQGSVLVLYPMKNESRRRERRLDIIQDLSQTYTKLIDLSEAESEGLFLEGTGSLVLDRANRVAYASISQRTSEEMVNRWCKVMEYEPVILHATDDKGESIYHTNVILSIGTEFVVVALDLLRDPKERAAVEGRILKSGRAIVPITLAQVQKFCGNILELTNKRRKKFIYISDTARRGFSERQLKRLASCCEIVSVSIPTIEQFGGGGVRCMLAELF